MSIGYLVSAKVSLLYEYKNGNVLLHCRTCDEKHRTSAERAPEAVNWHMEHCPGKWSKVKKGDWIYVAGPMSKGNSFLHVRAAVLAAEELRKQGFVPLVPQLSALWEMIGSSATYEDWLAYDFEMIKRCDALLRLPGESAGADREVAFASDLKKPVIFASLDELTNRPE